MEFGFNLLDSLAGICTVFIWLHARLSSNDTFLWSTTGHFIGTGICGKVIKEQVLPHEPSKQLQVNIPKNELPVLSQSDEVSTARLIWRHIDKNKGSYFQMAGLVLIPLVPTLLLHCCCSASHISCCFEFATSTLVTVPPKPRTLWWNYGYICEKVKLMVSSTGDWNPTTSTDLKNFHSL